jgi:predicted TPR repeat methyltransferase
MGPVFLSSGDLLLDRRYRWALDYLARGDRRAAAELLEQVVEAAPGFAAAWFALAGLREAQGDRERAIAALAEARNADGADHQGARLHLARLGAGDITPAMLTEHVRRTFDEHAPRFEDNLRRLDYRGPQLLLAAVMAAARAAGRAPRFGSLLDLGCGTGLAGQAFRSEVDRLTGIDLSPAMLAEAARKGIYDRLEQRELIAFLAAEADGGTRHDLVVAADVFVYLPDLAPAARAAARVLAPSGLFAFTVETHGGEGALLRPTLRYAHGSAHVRAAIADAGLDLSYFGEAATRSEKGEPVRGLIAVAMRQGEAAQAAGAT